jgi:two-component system, NarL family, nitrate/nitrite response regulator NarL
MAEQLVSATRDWAAAWPAPTPALPRRVVVIDDHRTFTELLRFALDAAPGFTCVGAAYDLESGLDLVTRQQPDLVVLDYEFAGDDRDGVVATAAIRMRHPDVYVVLLTGHADAKLVQRAADAGASCVMPKDGALNALLDALAASGPGGLLVHPALLASVNEAAAAEEAAQSRLSPREQDVLAMLALGLQTSAIASQLGISLNTCRGYVKSLLWKLDAHSQLEAVAIARRQGLVSDSDRQ